MYKLLLKNVLCCKLKKKNENKNTIVRTDPKSNEKIVETGAKQLYT
jgi:hypothetical protein